MADQHFGSTNKYFLGKIAVWIFPVMPLGTTNVQNWMCEVKDFHLHSFIVVFTNNYISYAKILIYLKHSLFMGISNFSLDALTCYRQVSTAKPRFHISHIDLTLSLQDASNWIWWYVLVGIGIFTSWYFFKDAVKHIFSPSMSSWPGDWKHTLEYQRVSDLLVLATNPPTDRPPRAASWYTSIPTTIRVDWNINNHIYETYWIKHQFWSQILYLVWDENKTKEDKRDNTNFSEILFLSPTSLSQNLTTSLAILITFKFCLIKVPGVSSVTWIIAFLSYLKLTY